MKNNCVFTFVLFVISLPILVYGMEGFSLRSLNNAMKMADKSKNEEITSMRSMVSMASFNFGATTSSELDQDALASYAEITSLGDITDTGIHSLHSISALDLDAARFDSISMLNIAMQLSVNPTLEDIRAAAKQYGMRVIWVENPKDNTEYILELTTNKAEVELKMTRQLEVPLDSFVTPHFHPFKHL